MAHKIAIIKTRDLYYNYGDDYSRIVESVTNWEEVTDEEFKVLNAASGRMDFSIIEQPIDTKKFVADTISKYLELVKEEEKNRAEEKKKREEAALQRKIKKELKDKDAKMKMLKKLQEELGIESK